MSLRSAYFKNFDFGGRPNLLFWGDTAGIAELSSILRFVVSASDDHFPLTAISEPVDGVAIVIRKSSSSQGVVAAAGGLDWILDDETIEWFADLVKELAESGRPGHQYLEIGRPDQITVRVSCGEYSDELRPNAPTASI